MSATIAETPFLSDRVTSTAATAQTKSIVRWRVRS
jgi:hypothetical protein